jgi:riboflavin kinase/FMN adenylyltransferase
MEKFYITNLADLPLLDPNSCVIGNFDGVHLGHKHLIEESKKAGYKTSIITFENLNKNNIYLTNIEQKSKYLEELGVDYLIIFPFRVIQLTFFNEFIKILKLLKVKMVTCGLDFRFGFKREGDIQDLKKHFKLNLVDYKEVNRVKISSSVIKELLSEGNIELANRFLGKEYTIVGEVVPGNKIGRNLGFPTANIKYDKYLLPKNGVYLTKVKHKDNLYLGMTNIGYNPTLNAQTEKRLEVHIIGFNEMIYGDKLELSFVKFLRDEKKFSSKEELISSLEETIEICKNYKDML